MSAALLAGGPGNTSPLPPNAVPIDLRIEDSLRRIALPIRPLSAAMVGVVAGSLAAHLAIVAATVVASHAPAAPQTEIAVEIVQEAPKPPTPVKPAPAKTLEPVKRDAAKPEAAKPPPPPPPPKVEQAKLEPPKPATPPAPPPEAAPKPVAEKPAPPKPPAESEDLAALQRELAALRAQQAALKSEAPLQPAAGTGPMTASTHGLALPSISGDDTGDVVGYQALVFSQLAKAKDIELDKYSGEAGTTGVHFEIDDSGRLVRVEVAVSSGKPALDAQALDIVRHAAPFPPPPKDGDHGFFANVNFLPPKHS